MTSVKGITLWETLLSIMLLSWLLLSFLALQQMLLKQAKASMLTSIAWHQVAGLSELVNYGEEKTLPRILLHWHDINQKILPKGNGMISGKYPHTIINLGWGGHSMPCARTLIDNPGCIQFAIKL